MAALLAMQAKQKRELWDDAALLHCCAGPRGVEFLNHLFVLLEGWLYVSLAKKKDGAMPQQRSLPMGIKDQTIIDGYKRLQAAILEHLKKEGEYTGAEVRNVMQHFDWMIAQWQHCRTLANIMHQYNTHWSAKEFSQHGTRYI